MSRKRCIHPPKNNLRMQGLQDQTVCQNRGFTAQQWVMLLFSFVLGIASVLTVDKVFLSHSPSAGTVQAAVSQP